LHADLWRVLWVPTLRVPQHSSASRVTDGGGENNSPPANINKVKSTSNAMLSRTVTSSVQVTALAGGRSSESVMSAHGLPRKLGFWGVKWLESGKVCVNMYIRVYMYIHMYMYISV